MQITQHTINTPYMVGPVHCYTGELAGDLVLFDTGPPTAASQEYLREKLDFGRLRHVIVTHCHIDHWGLASWLRVETGATVYLPRRDILKVLHHERRMESMYALLMSVGFEDEYVEALRQSMDRNNLFCSLPDEYLVAEQDIPEHLGIEVVDCPGHSQSDLVYTGEEWAVTGDTLLRGIFQSPLLDIDLEGGGRFRNYEAYSTTLPKLAGLRGLRILPGHRHTVESVDAIILSYVTKMLQRVEQMRPFSREDDIAEIIRRLFGPSFTDAFHIYLKASEIIFMKDFLEQPDLLRASLEEIGLFDDVAEHFCRAVGL
jgi:2,4-dienoyl-CoA reductase (NADPH2)